MIVLPPYFSKVRWKPYLLVFTSDIKQTFLMSMVAATSPAGSKSTLLIHVANNDAVSLEKYREKE